MIASEDTTSILIEHVACLPIHTLLPRMTHTSTMYFFLFVAVSIVTADYYTTDGYCQGTCRTTNPNESIYSAGTTKTANGQGFNTHCYKTGGVKIGGGSFNCPDKWWPETPRNGKGSCCQKDRPMVLLKHSDSGCCSISYVTPECSAETVVMQCVDYTAAVNFVSPDGA